MTVCIAVLFHWNYGTLDTPEYGRGAITASDRMITAADVQYEPQQQKIAYFGKSLVLVAGDIGIHSQAIRETEREIRGRQLPPHDIAVIYGRAIQATNRRQAENEILAPLGLNTDMFFSQQKDFSSGFVDTITSQLQNRRPIDAEALVVGSDGENAQIYSIDAYGNETCLDGVGFGSIGIGAWHAKSRLMQVGHVSNRFFAPALASIYAAKKNAEIAPGVGSATDMQLVLKEGTFPIWDRVPPELARLYDEYQKQVSTIGEALVAELNEFVGKPSTQIGVNEQPVKASGADGSKAARANETQSEQDDQGSSRINATG
jgi:hypothetical protein